MTLLARTYAAWIARLQAPAGGAISANGGATLRLRLCGDCAAAATPVEWTLDELFPTTCTMQALLSSILAAQPAGTSDNGSATESARIDAPFALRHGAHRAAGAWRDRLSPADYAQAMRRAKDMVASVGAGAANVAALAPTHIDAAAREIADAALEWLRSRAVRWALAVGVFIDAYPFTGAVYACSGAARVPRDLALASARRTRGLCT